MKKICLWLVFVLSACATTEKYEAVLKTWIGSSERELINSWGPPSSVYEVNGDKYLTYQSSRSGYVPGVAPTYQTSFIGNTAYTTSYGGTPGYSYNHHCKTTFTVSGGVINHWRYEGNSCKSK